MHMRRVLFIMWSCGIPNRERLYEVLNILSAHVHELSSHRSMQKIQCTTRSKRSKNQPWNDGHFTNMVFVNVAEVV